jgi:hypothetical protein
MYGRSLLLKTQWKEHVFKMGVLNKMNYPIPIKNEQE